VTTEKAILAGGCFWGMEELFRRQTGEVVTEVSPAGDFWEAEPGVAAAEAVDGVSAYLPAV
jgi:peptide methionine sulfoxide reductase MsrA